MRKRRRPVQDDAAKRAVAVQSWVSLARRLPCRVGAFLRAEHGVDRDVLEDLFAGKATATLATRSGAMTRYLAWVDQRGETDVLAEATVYRYLTCLRMEKRAPTTGRSVLQALGSSGGYGR